MSAHETRAFIRVLEAEGYEVDPQQARRPLARPA
jgi:hypothetical protein